VYRFIPRPHDTIRITIPEKNLEEKTNDQHGLFQCPLIILYRSEDIFPQEIIKQKHESVVFHRSTEYKTIYFEDL
jgi:hypothetical protein